MQNQPKTLSTEEKLDVISQLEKVNESVDICRNVRFAHISVHTIHDNVERIREGAKSGTKVFVWQDYENHVGMKCTKNYGCE